MELKEEMSNLIKVSFYTYISLGYCFFLGKIVPKGILRLLTILPVIIIFLTIPLSLTSVHTIGAVSFFLSWLANFKLILFAFEKGPLSSPSIPLATFIAMACFPINITQSSKGFSKPINPDKNGEAIHTPLTTIPTPQSKQTAVLNGRLLWFDFSCGLCIAQPNRKLLGYVTKCVLLVIFLRIYHNHHEAMNPMLAWIFFGFSVYLMLELMVTVSSAIVGRLLRLELDPQFDQPYLATSLQDFWGRRWNMMVNRILHPTIYDPVFKLSHRVVGRWWAPVPAILTTFAVSGLMHELIFFYFSRAWPTWEVMLFFCLHGVCLVMELVIKKVINGKWSLPQQLTAPLIVTFVLATSYWLFLPELLRCKIVERAFEEYQTVSELARDIVQIFPR